MRASLIILALAIVGCSQQNSQPTANYETLDEVISGYAFLQPETQALQDDEFSNPGYLWVDKGEALFNEPAANGQSCASCHTDEDRSLIGASTHFPKYDERAGTLINIEGRINLCRVTHQSAPKLEYESEHLLVLTTYVTNLSKGSRVAGELSPKVQSNYDNGQAYFNMRRGQFNLSCAQCHDDNAGKSLRGDTISQGHSNGFPTYRLEWQTLGSLHKRFQYCDIGVRAEPLPGGSQTYIDLEYFLANRGRGLQVETPAVRR